MLLKEPSLGYVHQLAVVSSRMLKATLAGDADTVAEILDTCKIEVLREALC